MSAPTPSEWALSLVSPGEWGDLPKRDRYLIALMLDRARESGRRERDAEVAELQAVVTASRETIGLAIPAARADERAAIVAWLRDSDDDHPWRGHRERLADTIERGAHLPPTPETTR